MHLHCVIRRQRPMAVNMSEKDIDTIRAGDPTGLDQRGTNPSSIVNDESTIPGGEIDPVYEKKAKVLNRAVRSGFSPHLSLLPVHINLQIC